MARAQSTAGRARLLYWRARDRGPWAAPGMPGSAAAANAPGCPRIDDRPALRPSGRVLAGFREPSAERKAAAGLAPLQDLGTLVVPEPRGAGDQAPAGD
jgi:hypothetical protein